MAEVSLRSGTSEHREIKALEATPAPRGGGRPLRGSAERRGSEKGRHTISLPRRVIPSMGINVL